MSLQIHKRIAYDDFNHHVLVAQKPPVVWRVENKTNVVIIKKIDAPIRPIEIILFPKGEASPMSKEWPESQGWFVSSELEILILTGLTKRHIAQLLEIKQ